MNRERQHRWSIVAFALVASVLVVSAVPVTAASEGLAVGSQHTTATDFQDAQALTNLTIDGSGESAHVQLAPPIVDDMEDGSMSEWMGDTGALAAQSTTVSHGTYAAQITGDGTFNNVWATQSSGLPRNVSQGDPLQFHLRYSQDENYIGGYFAAQAQQAKYEVALLDGSNTIELRRDNRSAGGTLTTLDSATTELDPNTWYVIDVTQWSTSGEMTIEVREKATGTVVATLTATDDTFSEGGIGLISDSTSGNFYADYYHHGTVATATYISSVHNVSNSEAAAINITSLTNASVNATVRTTDGTVLNQTTITNTGNHTLALAATSSSQLETVLEVDVTGSNPAFVVADESILFENHAPSGSNFAPSDGTKLSSSDVEFSVDVNDTEFSTAQGDSVDATLHIDGNAVGTKTVTSNSTVTITQTLSQGGDHTYHWVLNDSYGDTTTTATKTVTVPSEITFRNESNETQIINESVTIEATFYSADGTTVIKRSTTDGNISLDGLPTTKEFVITVSAEGWYDRRVYIDGIYEQSNVYLLNKSAHPNAIQTTFTFEDRTGEFPQDTTTLRIQRALDPDNDSTYTWETVAGDFFGASGNFPFSGAYQVRYRLVIENSNGETRVLGAFIPTADSTETLVIGNIQWPIQNGTQQYFDANLDNNAQEIQIRYYDHENDTEDIRIRVWEHQNKSNLIYDSNFSGPYGALAVNVSLTENQTGKTWVANYTAVDNGTTIQGQRIVGSSPMGLPVAAWLLGTMCLGFLTFVGSLYGPRTAPLGAVTMVGTAMVLMYFQLVYIGTGFVIVALLIAIGSLLYAEGMP